MTRRTIHCYIFDDAAQREAGVVFRQDEDTLDDPAAFGHELFSRLAGGVDDRLHGSPSGYAAFEAAVETLRAALPADQPELGRLLGRVEHCGIDLAGDQYHAGQAFGIAAEHLRRTIIDNAGAITATSAD